MSYPGGFDGFLNAMLQLNEKGRAAKAAYDPLSTENPEATCVGRPTPSALISTNLYLMRIESQEDMEIVLISSERNDEVRTVHMDDPEYLAEGMTHSRPLMYAPHLEIFSCGCDLESSSRFIQNWSPGNIRRSVLSFCTIFL